MSDPLLPPLVIKQSTVTDDGAPKHPYPQSYPLLTPHGETTTVRIELVKQLRAESKAAHMNLDGIPGVVAGGILHLAVLCKRAADEIERQDQDRAYGEKQAVLSARNAIIEECAKLVESAECLPGCDSFAHDDLCPVVNTEAAIRAIKSASTDGGNAS